MGRLSTWTLDGLWFAMMPSGLKTADVGGVCQVENGLYTVRYLIVNADDFGLSRGVNRGIIEAYRAGAVTSATMMTNMPGFEDAVRLAQQNPGLKVGLHFNITEGRPLTSPQRVPSLVGTDGRFSYDISSWQPKDVKRELAAQWNRLIGAGIVPTHVDSHQHVQMHKPVYRTVAKFARSKGIPLRRMFYAPERRLHPMTTDAFVTQVYFHKDGKARLLKALKNLRPGVTELHCHPGRMDPQLPHLSEWSVVREKELSVFLDPQVLAALHAERIRLVHFGMLRQIRKKGRTIGSR